MQRMVPCTTFSPVPDSIVLMLLSQVTLRFVLVTFKICIIMLIIIYNLFYLSLQITVIKVLFNLINFLSTLPIIIATNNSLLP